MKDKIVDALQKLSDQVLYALFYQDGLYSLVIVGLSAYAFAFFINYQP